MSKKLNKVLAVAVVLVLAVSLFALVACGGPEAPKSMDELQKNFTKAGAKTVTEDVKVGGLEIKAGPKADNPMLHLKINNADIHLVRKYAKDGRMDMDVTVSNVQVELKKGLNLLSVVKGMIGNLDETVIKNFSKVGLHVALTMNPKLDVAEYADYMELKDFTITGLDKVVDAKGDQWSILKDGDEKPLTGSYTPGEIMHDNAADNKVNPRQMKGKDPVGIFAQMDAWATAKTSEGAKAGEFIEQFILDNYQMISAYNFKDVKFDGENFSSNAAADFSKLYTVGDELLRCYSDNAIKDKENKDIIKINKLVDKLGLGKKVQGIANALVNLDAAAVKMSGTMEAVDDAWRIKTLKTEQTLSVELSKSFLEGVIANVLPIFNVDLTKIDLGNGTVLNLKDTVLQLVANGIVSPVKASVNATFAY